MTEVTSVRRRFVNGRVMSVNLTDIYGGGIRMLPSVETMFEFMYGE